MLSIQFSGHPSILRTRFGAWCAALMLVVLMACVVDLDEPCGAHQVELQGDIRGCVCDSESVPTADGKHCEPCADNEEPAGEVCACVGGFYRATATASCAPLGEDNAPGDSEPPSGEGDPCSSQADCAGLDADYCQTVVEPYMCLVQGCADGIRMCHGDRVCCVIPVAPLDSTRGLCVGRSSCVAPGEIVEP